jgi:hypothetical protein
VKFDGNLAGNSKVDFSTTNSRIFHQISIKFKIKANLTNTKKILECEQGHFQETIANAEQK